MQAHVLLPTGRAFEAAVDGLSALVGLAAQSAQAFGDVMVKQVDSSVLVLTQVRCGQVSHAGRLLVIIWHVVHVQVRVRELLECSVVYDR